MPPPSPPPARRRYLAEFTGTALLVTAVVGSGITANRLSPGDPGLQLLEHSAAVALALGALILAFGPVSGAHFNPVVSLAEWYQGRLSIRELGGYVVAQTGGAITGAVLANVMFALSAVQFSGHDRTGSHLWIGEAVGTGGLIVLVVALARSGRTSAGPAAVGAYIGAACWFTSSASFVNPAVTLGRAFTDTYTGIALASVPGFVLAQVAGLAVGLALAGALYPAAAASDEAAAPDEAAAASDEGAGQHPEGADDQGDAEVVQPVPARRLPLPVRRPRLRRPLLAPVVDRHEQHHRHDHADDQQ